MNVRLPSGDDWFDCSCGREHWGVFGAAGLLLARPTAEGIQILLQHRAAWSDGGATWGIPGGALDYMETPEEAALREAQEEAGVSQNDLTIIGTSVMDHGNWRYTTVLAMTTANIDLVIDDESLAMEWVDVERIAAMPLHPAFASSWGGLRKRLAKEMLTAIV